MATADQIDTPGLTTAALYAAALESLPDAIVVTTVTGGILYLNSAAIRLIGTRRNSARGRMLSDVITLLDGVTREPVGDALTRFIARSANRRPGEFDLLLRRSGTEIPIEDTCSILRGLDGEAVGLVLVLRDATALCELTRDATHDSLTRLANRHEFERRLERLFDTLHTGEAHALLYMDLDHFKAVNDAHGHAAGDYVLRKVADVFRAVVRERDTLARLGGDEFALLLEHCPIDLASEHARALQRALGEQKFFWAGMSFRLGVSIGAVAIIAGNHTPASVLAAADRACYSAKRGCNSELGRRDALPVTLGPFSDTSA